MNREDLISDPRYATHATRLKIADEVDETVSRWTRRYPRDRIIEILMEGGVPCAPVRAVDEVVADPETGMRGTLIESDYPGRGPIRVLGLPIKMSETSQAATKSRRPPTLGEHTAEILGQIGIDSVEMERLRTEGVI